MKDFAWVVERQRNGQWFALFIFSTRRNARLVAARNQDAYPTRVRKYVRAGK